MPTNEVTGWTAPEPGVRAPVDIPIGTLGQQDASAVAITGGAITGTTVALSPQATGVVAAGTTAADATAITDGVTVVGTVAAGTGVILPPGAGISAWVFNRGANALLVYPSTGGAINALSANAGFSVAAGKAAIFVAVGALQRHSLLGA